MSLFFHRVYSSCFHKTFRGNGLIAEMCSYQIAEVCLHIKLPGSWDITAVRNFEQFRIYSSAYGVSVEICEAAFPLQERGILIYEDAGQRIRTDDGKICRYVGNYGISGVESAVYCQEYQIGARGKYAAFFSNRRKEVTESFLLGSIGLEHIFADYGRVILHSSFIIYKGKGIIFSAPSGTGKSTQAELWRCSRRGAEIINGDRCVLSCDDGEAKVHGIPFCGTSGISLNKSASIRALIVLRQGKENQIRRLRPAEAFGLLFSECGVNRWSKEDTGNVTAVLGQIISSVPVFYYSCLPDVSSVDVLEETLDRCDRSGKE